MFENLQEIWRRQTAQARAALVLGVVLIVAALIYLSFSVLKRDYQVLFSGLDPQDAATIVAELDKMKVPYRLGPDETTILVESSQVHATRLKLMGKGVNLRGGVGFEIFNTTDFGVTEFAQKINYQRALQGELARTIMALDAVKSARVHLVLPDSGLFRRADQKPKAAVTLALRDNRSLQPEQVVGIQRLVAASVPQIDPTAVTVLDQRGATLSRNAGPESEDAAIGLGGKHEFEAYLARKVVAVLDKTFGPGSAIVSVDVTLNHDQVRITREDFSPFGPDNAKSRTIVRSRNSLQSGATAPAAMPAAADQPAALSVTPPARPTVTTSEIEYQNNRTVEQTVSKPGSVQRISVGVMLPQTLRPDKLRELTQVLSMAVGLSSERGDEIAISSLDQFAASASAPVAPSEPATEAAQIQAQTETQSAPGFLRHLADNDILAIAVIAILLTVALSVALMSLATARRKPAATTLTADERDRLLAQMRQWLGTSER